MAVNDEPGALRQALAQAPAAPGGGRPAGRHRVSFGRRSHREADVPSSRAGRIRRARAVAPTARGRRGAGQPSRQEREAARAGAALMKKDQRLHREPDPRVRRSLVVALATAALLAAGALTVVGVRVEQVHLAYRLDALRSERGARARPDPAARDRGGDAALAEPHRGAGATDRPRGGRARSDPAGEGVRGRRHRVWPRLAVARRPCRVTRPPAQ